jgi:hypothetical protein
METNPVQQKMEYLADSWNDIPKKKIKIIRSLIKYSDYNMLDAFYWYMLGMGTGVTDIVILFETEFMEYEYFGTNLIKELEGTVQLWNQAEFPGEMKKEKIEWCPDYKYSREDEPLLFITNINALSEALHLQKGRYLVANLLMPHNGKERQVQKWITALTEKEISEQVRILLTDYEEKIIFEELAFRYPKRVYTWQPDIDTGNVIEKVASMGEAGEPSTEYRISYARLLKAIGANDYSKTLHEGGKCLEIADANLTSDAFWPAQAVVILIMLSNEDWKNNHEEKALERAGSAITIARAASGLMGSHGGSPLLAQALMNEAVMYCYKKKWKEAAPLYEEAAANYEKANIPLNAMESCRMAGYCHAKKWDSEIALSNLVRGYTIACSIEERVLQPSTFSLLLLQLLKENYREHIREEELERKATEVYGRGWREKIKQTWKDTDIEKLYEANPCLAEGQK